MLYNITLFDAILLLMKYSCTNRSMLREVRQSPAKSIRRGGSLQAAQHQEDADLRPRPRHPQRSPQLQHRAHPRRSQNRPRTHRLQPRGGRRVDPQQRQELRGCQIKVHHGRKRGGTLGASCEGSLPGHEKHR